MAHRCCQIIVPWQTRAIFRRLSSFVGDQKRIEENNILFLHAFVFYIFRFESCLSARLAIRVGMQQRSPATHALLCIFCLWCIPLVYECIALQPMLCFSTFDCHSVLIGHFASSNEMCIASLTACQCAMQETSGESRIVPISVQLTKYQHV